ncbi:hypothetical protein Cni_G22839 [Canna indica]|uniref:Uncharacterized protein n=1 Tax=Canna indica TaxID=4628 RepID=A0AAQ3KT36_9LILI|nr:hypothetical protein Cni_G22839 [Canna indica]
MLPSSGESWRLQAIVERPHPRSTRASSILRRWHELEDASVVDRERERLRFPSPSSNSRNRQKDGKSCNHAKWVDDFELSSNESDGNDNRREINKPTKAASIVQNAKAEDIDDRETSREQSPVLGGSLFAGGEGKSAAEEEGKSTPASQASHHREGTVGRPSSLKLGDSGHTAVSRIKGSGWTLRRQVATVESDMLREEDRGKAMGDDRVGIQDPSGKQD